MRRGRKIKISVNISVQASDRCLEIDGGEMDGALNIRINRKNF
jgi:hypothetical protein